MEGGGHYKRLSAHRSCKNCGVPPSFLSQGFNGHSRVKHRKVQTFLAPSVTGVIVCPTSPWTVRIRVKLHHRKNNWVMNPRAVPRNVWKVGLIAFFANPSDKVWAIFESGPASNGGAIPVSVLPYTDKRRTILSHSLSFHNSA